jgi:branched-chain amino acid aminotransferase
VIELEESNAKEGGASLSFGTVFTENMLLAEYKDGVGWSTFRVQPYAPFSLDPATAVFHYGQAVFDGLKAYRGNDGQIRLFRPSTYIERLNASARRMCMPVLDLKQAIRALIELVRSVQNSVPAGDGMSLYLRPAMIASEPFLGVRPAKRYLFFVIASPSGPYYEDEKALRIRVENRYARAVRGGVGAAKTGANYAASLLAAEEAYQDGFDQVLWLDGTRHEYLEEAGTMNIMLRLGSEVVTPPLGGTILPGVMRNSALRLLRDWGITAIERAISVNEVVAASGEGTLREAWGTGTASGIVPIGELAYRSQNLVINGGTAGELAERLKTALADIQYGRTPDRHKWTVRLDD